MPLYNPPGASDVCVATAITAAEPLPAENTYFVSKGVQRQRQQRRSYRTDGQGDDRRGADGTRLEPGRHLPRGRGLLLSQLPTEMATGLLSVIPASASRAWEDANPGSH